VTERDLDDGMAHEDLCRYLAACYYEPDAAFAQERLFDSMARAARRLDPELAEQARAVGEAFAAEDLQALLVDYTRLFLGPGPALARPYGSCWLGGEPQGMQASTMAVLDLYRQGGFEIDESFRELPDHVAVELEFLYALTFARNEAARQARTEERVAADRLRGRFLAEHVGAWGGAFARAVQAQAQTDFYRRLGAMTRRFLELETAAAPRH
jgi:TorA maturation chaperone TorD